LISDFTAKEQKRWGLLAIFILLIAAVIMTLLKRRYDNALQIIQQRKELDDYHHRNRAILEAMPDLVFTLDRTGIILDYQSGSDELLFMSPERFIGRSFVEVMPQKVAENGYFLLKQVIDTGKPQHYEYPLLINEQDLYFELRMSKIDDHNILAIARDITARKQAEKQLTWQATHDALTHLPNRVLFYDRLSQAVTKSLRQPSPFALLYIDINGFKPVNDTLGHSLGDQLLIEFAKRLKQHLRASDTFARLAGDEFAIILFDCESETKAKELVSKLHHLIEMPFHIDSHQIMISASIGLIWTNRWEGSVDALVNTADQAMYREKHLQKQEKQDTAR
ncbi:MAG: GGDEF domain-containing protein, partial [Oceanospirillales bacterium]